MIEAAAEADGPSIRRRAVIKKPLPEPDRLDFELPAGHCCLVTEDGSDLTAQVVQRLAQRGWPVVVLRFPKSVVPRRSQLPESVPLVEVDDLSEENLKARLAEVAGVYGPVAVFLHIQPACGDCLDEALPFRDSDRLALQEVFLIAKHLKEPLNKAARIGRAAFMVAARLDGEFGLGDQYIYDPINGGLFGLVKSLNLEWSPVFCRAVDLDPTLAPGRAADLLVAELADPNRLVVEVAYGPGGRTTLALEPQVV